MTESNPPQAFIPLRRRDLIELCNDDGGLPGAEGGAKEFRQFCEILSAYYHFKAHRTLERMKDNFAPFDPDDDTHSLRSLTETQTATMEENLSDALEAVLRRANYLPLDQAALDQSMSEEALVSLHTHVDFNDFERLLCYYRGGKEKTVSVKKFFRRHELRFENLERVALLLKFKDEAYFRGRKRKLEKLNFEPGSMHLYLYKNIPRPDLELLFPNIKVRMTLKDTLLLSVPAIGAAVPLILKVLPSLGLVLGAFALIAFGPEAASRFNIDPDSKQAIFAVLVAVLSIGIALGGFAFKQYTKYQHKCLKFSKKVADTLFFNNLVSNRGVLHTLVDAAEEEESKEIILVYYHLLNAGRPLTRVQLDSRIEQWIEEKFHARINFDIDKALANLANLHAPIDNSEDSLVPPCAQPLLRTNDDGSLVVLPLGAAKAMIDQVWDRIFDYQKVRPAAVAGELG